MLEERDRVGKFTSHALPVVRPASEQTEVKPGHGEPRVEIRSHPVMISSALEISDPFTAESQYVVRTGIEPVDLEQTATGLFSSQQQSGMRQENGLKQQYVRIAGSLRRQCLDETEGFRELLLPQQFERASEAPS